MTPRDDRPRPRSARRAAGSARAAGVTLIELVIALALIALVAGLALTQLAVPQKQAQLKADMAQANALAQTVSAFYAVNGCYPDQTSTQTAPFAGSMPANLGPYVGGPWPANQLYGTFDQNWSWVGSGATAYYVGVIPQSVWVGNARGYVLVVNNQAVKTC